MGPCLRRDDAKIVDPACYISSQTLRPLIEGTDRLHPSNPLIYSGTAYLRRFAGVSIKETNNG